MIRCLMFNTEKGKNAINIIGTKYNKDEKKFTHNSRRSFFSLFGSLSFAHIVDTFLTFLTFSTLDDNNIFFTSNPSS